MILEEYEEICKNCEGKGKKLVPGWYVYFGTGEKRKAYVICKVCNGIGKIDWIKKMKDGNESENIKIRGL